MNNGGEAVLLGALSGGLIGGAVGGVGGAALGAGLGAGTGLLLASEFPQGSYMYPGGVWNASTPEKIRMVESGLAAFEKCTIDLSATYAAWKAKFHQAWADYYSCLMKIDAMLCAWRARGECLSKCDLAKMEVLMREGHIRHKKLKELLMMGAEVASMQRNCCQFTARLQSMILYLDQMCARDCNLLMAAPMTPLPGAPGAL